MPTENLIHGNIKIVAYLEDIKVHNNLFALKKFIVKLGRAPYEPGKGTIWGTV